MSMEDIFRSSLSGKFTTADALAAEYPEGVTIVGFSYVEVKGKPMAAMKVAEGGGQSFLAGSTAFAELVSKLEAEYGDAEQIDAALRAAPQRIRIYPIITLRNGNKFRPVQYVDETLDLETGEIS